MTLAAGTRLGPYEIVALLGAGGMGEVYRARDTRLGRVAALKVLPAEIAADRERLARFESEARAASALNHPNIVTIYDVGQEGGTAWISMELVEGSTLREILVEGPLPARRAVALAAQLADGLARAHEAGIVHRDFKPENIVVTKLGRAKILDFGLARFADSGAAALSQAPTAAERTRPGTVMGTVGYMSPEQVHGLTADHRTDIFALGAVLYEMVAGRRAFAGKLPADVMMAILREDPPDLPPSASPGLARIVKRCLEKNPEERFQSARDLAFALESLSGDSGAGSAATSAPRRSRPWIGLTAVIGAAAAFALAWFLRPVLTAGAGAPSFSRAVRLAGGAGRQFGAVLSPDGKWVAYLSDARGPTDVFVKFLAGGEAVNLTARTGLNVQSRVEIGGPDVSPDGTLLLVDAAAPGNPPVSNPSGYESWAIPVPLGGPPRRFLADAHTVHFSPDGRRIVYVRAGASRGDTLMAADADGGSPREILKPRGGLHAHWPAWSPDGKFVYFIYGIVGSNGEPSEIFRVPAVGGEPEPVVRTSRRAVFPVPMPDGRGLLYSANVDSADLGLWWRPLGRGEPRRLTVGVGSYAESRLSADGRFLVSTLVDVRQSLLSIPVSAEAEMTAPRALTDGETGDLDPDVVPHSGRIVFSSSRSGSRNLWLAAADGTDPQPLTAGNALDERPAVSPDGRQVAFVSDRGGQRGIWVVPIEGGAPHRIAAAQVLDRLCWSPDGREILYAAPAGDVPGLFRLTIANGKIARLPTPGAAHSGAWSPRGDLIAYLEPILSGPTKLRFIEPGGNPVSKDSADAGPLLLNGFLAWSPDGQSLAAMAVPGSGETSLWIVDPAAVGSSRRLRSLPAESRGRGLAWAPDGKSLIVGSFRSTSNVVLFTRER
jgi:Tol biopolymer transport system component